MHSCARERKNPIGLHNLPLTNLGPLWQNRGWRDPTSKKKVTPVTTVGREEWRQRNPKRVICCRIRFTCRALVSNCRIIERKRRGKTWVILMITQLFAGIRCAWTTPITQTQITRPHKCLPFVIRNQSNLCLNPGQFTLFGEKRTEKGGKKRLIKNKRMENSAAGLIPWRWKYIGTIVMGVRVRVSRKIPDSSRLRQTLACFPRSLCLLVTSHARFEGGSRKRWRGKMVAGSRHVKISKPRSYAQR